MEGQEVRVRAVPLAPESAPYRTELLLELHDTETILDGGRVKPEVVGSVSVSVLRGRIEIEVARVDEAWTGAVEVTVA